MRWPLHNRATPDTPRGMPTPAGRLCVSRPGGNPAYTIVIGVPVFGFTTSQTGTRRRQPDPRAGASRGGPTRSSGSPTPPSGSSAHRTHIQEPPIWERRGEVACGVLAGLVGDCESARRDGRYPRSKPAVRTKPAEIEGRGAIVVVELRWRPSPGGLLTSAADRGHQSIRPSKTV